MQIVEVSSDFPFTEADMRKFFSFCGEIATIELLFKEGDQLVQYKAELTFSSGTNSALLLDKSTYEGHQIKVGLKPIEIKVQPETISFSETYHLVQPQPPQNTSILQSVIDFNQRYDLTGKASRAILFIPKLLLKPCMTKPLPAQTITQAEAPDAGASTQQADSTKQATASNANPGNEP